jgi:dGTPase
MDSTSRAAAAPFATPPQAGGIRRHAEPADPLRSPFEVDRRRIINCTAFRRLEHKTQVFTSDYHDHFRTRLTHTLEVAEIARTLARLLQVDHELVVAIALAHDLGHPPFGHAGEKALAEAMKGRGGFNHNVHSLRVVDYLEHPFPQFRGLNLTAAVRDGLLGHATRYDQPDSAAAHGVSIEARIASLADRIAYSCHDLEDAIGAGLLSLEALDAVAAWRTACRQARGTAQAAHVHALRRPTLDALLDRLIADAVRRWDAALQDVATPEGAAAMPDGAFDLSPGVEAELQQLEEFLLTQVYARPEIAAMDAAGRERVLRLFAAYERDPSLLPDRYRQRIDESGVSRVVCDYIAGMTDRFCTEACARISGG